MYIDELVSWILKENHCSPTILDALELVVVQRDEEFWFGVGLLNSYVGSGK